jgi:serine protease Do
MKSRVTLGIIGWLFIMFINNKAMAQTITIEQVPDNTAKEEITIKKISPAGVDKETQEIVIRKKGSKDSKITLDIQGSTLLINGKPMAEFKEDGITINNRKIIIKDGNKMTFDFEGDMINGLDNPDNIKSVTIDKLNLGRKIDKDVRDRLDNSMLKYFEFKDDDTEFGGNGETTKTYLGVVTENDAEGEKITSVEKASPAEKAGLLKGDIIYKVGNKKIKTYVDLTEVITSKKDADKATVYFLREGKKKEVEATLGVRKNNFTINKVFTYKMPNGKVRSLRVPRPPTEQQWPQDMEMDGNFNFDNNRLFELRKPKLGLKIQDTEEGNGVKVLSVDEESTSAKAGILKDDVVTEIAGIKIKNTDEAREELHNNATKNSYSIKVNRAGKEVECVIKIPKKLKTANL